MSQKLTLKKTRTWETFQKDRLEKMSDSVINACTLAKSRFDEFLYSEYDGLDTEKFIIHIKSLPEDDRDEELFSVLQSWVDWITDTFELNRASTIQSFSRLNKYLWYRRIKITSHDIKDEIDWPELIQEEKYAPSEDEFIKIISGMMWRNQGFCIGLASGGMRPVEQMGTQNKHYTLLPNGRYKLEIPYYLTKKRISRTIIFSKEYTPYIARRLKERQDEDDFIWTTRKNIPQSFFNKYSHLKKDRATIKAIKRFATDMLSVIRKSLKVVLKNLGLDMRYESTGEHKITLYSLRARFITRALKVLDGDVVHAIVGHGAYLQSYQRRTLEEKAELFEEVESEIMIFDQSKNIEKIRKLTDANKKVNELEDKVEAIQKRSNMPTMRINDLSETIKKILRENPDLLKT